MQVQGSSCVKVRLLFSSWASLLRSLDSGKCIQYPELGSAEIKNWHWRISCLRPCSVLSTHFQKDCSTDVSMTDEQKRVSSEEEGDISNGVEEGFTRK